MPSSPTSTVQTPRVLTLLALALLLFSPTQITIRQILLRLTGARFGEIHRLAPDPDGRGTRVDDPLAVFIPHQLKGTRFWLKTADFRILDNGRTWMLLDAPLTSVQEALGKKGRYWTGFARRTPAVRLALAWPTLHATPADMILGVATILLLFLLLTHPDLWRQLRLPWEVILLLVIAAASAVPALRLADHSINVCTNWKISLKEWIQYAEVLIAGYLVLKMALDTPRRRAQATAILLAGAGLVIGLGLIEYILILKGNSPHGLVDLGQLDSCFGFQYNPSRSHLAGSESSRNVLATYLLLILPFAAGLAITTRNRWFRAASILVLVFGLILLQQAALLVCALAGITAAALFSRRAFAVPITLGTCALVIGLAVTLIPKYGTVLMDSVALYRYSDPYGLLPMPAKGKSSETFKKWDPWQQKYTEMQAALNGVGLSPVLGHGIGDYQKRINGFFTQGPLPSLWLQKSPANLMERDAHGIYLVQAVETGLLGLLALWLMFAAFLRQTAQTALEAQDCRDRSLAIGAVGALVAVCLAGFFISPLIRGVQFILIAMAAIPAAALSPAPDSTAAPTTSEGDSNPSPQD